MTNTKPMRWAACTGLALLLGFLFLVNALWIQIDDRPPRWDESANLTFAERGLNLLKQGRILEAFDSRGALRPNFVPVLHSLTFPLYEHSTKVAIFVLNTAALTGTSLALFGLASRLYGPGVALLAVLIFNTFPAVSLWSRYYNLDLPLTALVTATVWAAYRLWEEDFESRWFAGLLGAFVTMGVCAKHMYSPLVAAPLLWLVIQHARRVGYSPSRLVGANPVLYGGLAIAFVIGVLFHVVLNYAMFREGVVRTLFTERSVLAEAGFRIPSLLQKLTMFNYQFARAGDPESMPYLYYGAVTSGALALLFFWRRGMGFILAWIAGTFVLFVLMVRITVPYYYIPVLPAAALMIAAGVLGWLPAFQHRAGRWTTPAVAVVVVALSGYLLTIHLQRSLGTASPWEILARAPAVFAAVEPKGNPYVSRRYWDVTYVDGNVGTLPYPHYWPVKEMLKAVDAGRTDAGMQRKANVALLTNYEWMCGDQFEYRIWQLDLQDRLTLLQPLPSQLGQAPEKFIAQYDFLALKTGDIFKRDFYGLAWADRSQAFVNTLTADDFRMLRTAGFQPLLQTRLPDGSDAWIWRSGSKHLADLRLIDSLDSATRTIKSPGATSTSSFTINDETRRVLYQHPVPQPDVNELTWRALAIPADAVLNFGVALSPQMWGQARSDGVEFRIDITDQGTRQTIFRALVNPAHTPADRRWQDHAISLARFAGRRVDLHLMTTPSLADNTSFDHAGWSGLTIGTAQ